MKRAAPADAETRASVSRGRRWQESSGRYGDSYEAEAEDLELLDMSGRAGTRRFLTAGSERGDRHDAACRIVETLHVKKVDEDFF